MHCLEPYWLRTSFILIFLSNESHQKKSEPCVTYREMKVSMFFNMVLFYASHSM